MPTFYIFIGNIDSRMVVLKVPGRTVVNPESYETWLHVHNLEDADAVLIAETQIEQLLTDIRNTAALS